MTDAGDPHSLVVQVERAYGLNIVAIERLDGELDLNFRVSTLQGDYLLKIISAAELAEVSVEQTAVLQWCDPVETGLPIPAVLRTVDGNAQGVVVIDGVARVARMVAFLPGTTADKVVLDADALHTVGALAGRLVERLSTYPAPVAPARHPWDVFRPEQAMEIIRGARALPHRDRILGVLESYGAAVLPVLRALPRQLIHNDLNRHNVLVGEGGAVTGILDFGDAVLAPRVVELGTLVAYFSGDDERWAQSVADLARGFVAASPLSADELALVPHIAGARCALAAGVGLAYADRTDDLQQKAYVSRNAAASLGRLARYEQHFADAASLVAVLPSRPSPLPPTGRTPHD